MAATSAPGRIGGSRASAVWLYDSGLDELLHQLVDVLPITSFAELGCNDYNEDVVFLDSVDDPVALARRSNRPVILQRPHERFTQ